MFLEKSRNKNYTNVHADSFLRRKTISQMKIRHIGLFIQEKESILLNDFYLFHFKVEGCARVSSVRSEIKMSL
jgi:hypothetical protein